MILATHALVGAALAETVPNHPVLAFSIGFVSHFLLDAIPHWDYPLKSIKEVRDNPLGMDMPFGPAFFRDLLFIGLDFSAGILLSILIFRNQLSPAIFFGMIGGMTPDFLQFVYTKLRVPPLTWLQKFHQWIHTSVRIKDAFWGPFFQIAFLVVFFALDTLVLRLFF